jgi:Domain of unknown function (DUF4328)
VSAPLDWSGFGRGLRTLTYPLEQLGRILMWLLVADVVVNAFSIPALFHHLHRLQFAARYDASSASGEAGSSGDELALVTLFGLGVVIACAVTFGVWFYRARRNVEAYGGTHQHFGPSWAVAGWFVPVLNLFVPIRMMLDVLRDSLARPRVRDYAVLALWWLAWVARWAAYLSAGHFARIHGGIALNIVTSCADIVAALGLIYLVWRISAAHAVLERELDARPASTA